MSQIKSDNIRKENVVQAVLVLDTFNEEFLPISDDIPHALLPIVNKPLIDYTLEFLSLGGIEETFLFCCTHIDEIKKHINKSVKKSDGWTLTMRVNIIVSESCRSFGDCLRDLDAKGLIRNNFVLLEPGAISNVQLLPLIKKHNDICKQGKGAAMSLIFQEAGVGHISRCPEEEVLVATDSCNRVLFHKKLGKSKEKKVEFPLDIFLENSSISLMHNLKDTHIAICSSTVLPLFSDNFDFQNKDDFVRGLLINEEILGSTVYCEVLKGSQFGGAVTNWRMYQALSRELKNNWIFPLMPSARRNRVFKKDVVLGEGSIVHDIGLLQRTILGDNVVLGNNVKIEDSFVFSNTKIEDDVIITHSIVGSNCVLKSKSKITAGSILGNGSIIEKGVFVENSLIQARKPDNYDNSDKLGSKAYRLRISEDSDEDNFVTTLTKKMSRLHIHENGYKSDSDVDGFSDSEEDGLSYTQSPTPDDTKLFFNEVNDSLARGFEDNLLCDNLILEINSSRYAYNVTVEEVNFNVIRAILMMSLSQPFGPQYFSYFSRLLSYFVPILKHYIRNESAMFNCLQAIEDVATTSGELNDKWIMFTLQHFYDKDYVTEDAILDWFAKVNQQSMFHKKVKPFTDWLQQAEEASSSEED